MVELATHLQADSARERWQAIEQLKKAPRAAVDTHTVFLLTKALGDEHPFVRWQAGVTLVKRAEGVQKLVEAVRNSTAQPGTALRQSAAVDALALKASPMAYPALIEALLAQDILVRQSAAEALGRQKNPEAVPHLIRAMEDSSPWVRRAAANALGHLGKKEAAASLVKGLQDQAVLVRRSSAYALGALRATEAISHLQISLTDKDPLTRRNAAWALGRLGSREVIPHLTRLVGDTALDGDVAAVARQSIGNLTKPGWWRIITAVRRRFRRQEI